MLVGLATLKNRRYSIFEEIGGRMYLVDKKISPDPIDRSPLKNRVLQITFGKNISASLFDIF